jgi:hypothetical protein
MSWIIISSLNAYDQIVDPFGRRRTMLYTIPIMAVALLLASIFFHRKLNQAFWIAEKKLMIQA